MNNMNKNIISLTLLTASFYVVGAAQEPQPQPKLIPSLRDLALQRVVHTMTSQEEAQRFVRDPQQFEEYVESYGVSSGAIKELIVDRLLRKYKSKIDCCNIACNNSFRMCWHPSGDLIAYGFFDGKVGISNVNTGEAIKQLERPQSNWIWSLDWHPDGKFLAGSNGNAIIIWDVDTGAIVKRLEGHQDVVLSVRWDLSGSLVASGSQDGTIGIWDWYTGQMLKQMEGHVGSVVSLNWHPHGRSLASGGQDGMICIWDSNTGQELRRFENQECVWSVSWHPDGELLASGSENGTVCIWDTNTGHLFRRLEGHCHVVRSVDWDPSGRLLASGSHDQTVCIWDVKGQTIKKQKCEHSCLSALWRHPRGDVLAVKLGSSVILWDIQAYDRLIGSLSLMQALYFIYCMEHADIMRLEDKGKEEEKQPMDDIDQDQSFISRNIRSFFGFDQIEQSLHALKGIGSSSSFSSSSVQEKTPQAYMKDLEASLPDALKRMLKKDNHEERGEHHA